MFIGKPVCVAPVGDRCGEGVMWNADDGSVFWVDVLRFLIHRLEPSQGTVKSWFFDEPVVGLAPTNLPGVLVVALGSSVILWDWKSDRRIHTLFTLPGWPGVRLNDARADPLGNFWMGSMKNNTLANGELCDPGPGLGTLYRIAPDLSVSQWRDQIGISNTLCWTLDRTKFYFGDTLENELWVYDYDAKNGSIKNEQPFFSGFQRGQPDGSAIDEHGFIWNCRFGGSCIVRVAPNGEVDQVIEMPELNITTCCFGGEDLKSLYVTSASIDRRAGDRLAGSLYRIDVDVAGVPIHQFNASHSAGLLEASSHHVMVNS
jgi:sugar lactone lactonase YvrE